MGMDKFNSRLLSKTAFEATAELVTTSEIKLIQFELHMSLVVGKSMYEKYDFWTGLN